MIDNEILDELSTTYSDHEKLSSMLNDLKYDVNIVFWGNELTKEAYYSNMDLAEALFEYAFENAKEFRDFKELAFAVGNSSGFDDQEWAKELMNKAIENITLLRDLRILADEVSRKNLGFYDPTMAMSLYKEAIEKSQTAYDFYCIAESLCSKELLDDKDWAMDVYQKAVEAAKDADELTYIADSIADEDNLADEQWAEELYAIAKEFEEGKELE